MTLRREVCTAAAGARTEQEFFARLAQAGVLVRQRYSTISPGQVTGYAVGLPAPHGRDGGTIWYGGGKLAADLTLPKLRPGGRAAAERARSGSRVLSGAARAVLRNTVTEAAQQAGDEAGFFARLREAGVLVRLRFSDAIRARSPATPSPCPAHRPDGTPRWYGGGRLAAGLTLPRLRRGWDGARSGPRNVPGVPVHRPGTGRDLRARGPSGRRGAEHIRRCAADDPAGAADAAWAAADALHVAARALGSPALRRAADSYDRRPAPATARAAPPPAREPASGSRPVMSMTGAR